MDLFCPPGDDKLVDTLLAEAIEAFEKRRVAFISCLGLHPLIIKRARRYIYIRPRMVQGPGLLNWKGDSNLQSFVQNPENWHLSFSDGDIGFYSLGSEN